MSDESKTSEWLDSTVIPWAKRLACSVLPPDGIIPTLLSAILLAMRDTQFGNRFYLVRPVTLVGGGEPQKIVDTQPNGRMRQVNVWVDSAVDGPLPLIRISTGASGTGSGGIRAAPGQVNELGLVPQDVMLYAASSQDITLYVIEYG